LADLLSQEEIDNLLRALSGGGLSSEEALQDEKVKVYDFKSANKFSKEQIKILNNIYENFSQLFSNYLSGTLRAACHVDIISVEERTYYEYINSLPSPIVLAILNISPMGSPTLLEFSSIISGEIINRLLGGNGGRTDTARGYTEIDLALLEKTIKNLCRLVDSSWSKVIDVSTAFERIETSPQFAQIVAFNETIAIITIRVKIGDDVVGFMNVCIPHIAIEPIAKQLNTKFWYTKEKDDNKANFNLIKQKIDNTKVDVSVTFNDTAAKVSDILNLQRGDVLQLVHNTDEALQVKINDKEKFSGELGVIKNKYVVRITNTIKEADTDNE
jgi:flagellar motor switch protein FliM